MAAAQLRPQDGAAKSGNLLCPDPSAHHQNPTHQTHASSAALHVTSADRSAPSLRAGPGAQKNPAATGAAAGLRFAKPQDLPGFPVVGIDAQHSGLAAATLAAANQKPVEWWKPSLSESASKAALLAQDYKMAPAWQPETSTAGPKAAVLAHKDGSKAKHSRPNASQGSSSAAGPAFTNKASIQQRSRGIEGESKKAVQAAATGAVSGSRKRAESMPVTAPSYPDAANSKRNARNAAAIAHRPTQKDEPAPAIDTTRIHNIARNMAKEIHTELPPANAEIEEQRHQDALRASALSMAKKMYNVQQAHINAVTTSLSSDGHSQIAAAKARQSDQAPPAVSGDELKQQAMQYINLQEAAQKLAAERLAKIKTDEDSAFRDYYGYGKKQTRKRLSVRLGRRRAASDGDMIDSDEEQSRNIHSQMSLFHNRLAQVDERKRQKDREALLVAAQKKVNAQMHEMDEKVFMETGKAPPSILEEWETKAHARAMAASEARMAHHGKIHVGGGRYMEQSEIDAVAAARVQPTLDEINDKAEKQRAKDEETRLEQEEKRRQARLEKEREAELKAENRRVKSEEKQATKARKAEERAAAQTEKDTERAKRSEERKTQKEEKRKSKDVAAASATETSASVAPASATTVKHAVEVPRSSARITKHDLDNSPGPPSDPAKMKRDNKPADLQLSHSTENTERSKAEELTLPLMSPSRLDSAKLRSILNKFRRRSKALESPNSDSSPTKSSFVGGAAFTGARHPEAGLKSSANRTPSSARISNADPDIVGAAGSISSLSSDEGEVATRLGRPTFTRTSSGLSEPTRGGINDDELDETRDTFDEKLVPPPKFSATEGRRSPVRETIFREEL